MAANSAGQIFATVATLAVIPKISSRHPKLVEYRSGQARDDRIARFAFDDANMSSRFLVGIASGRRRNLYHDERYGSES
jgi:hypothetical protein